MAKKPKQGASGGEAAAKAKRASGGARALSLVIAVVLVTLFFDSVMVLAGGMIPTGVAYLVDRHPRKYAARTVGWMNLAGCLIVVLDLWDGGGSIEAAFELLMDPINWTIMFGSAAFGWIIYFALPPIVGGYLQLSQEMKLKELAKTQKTLEKEWGKEVRRDADLDRLEAVEDELAAQADRETSRAGAGGAAGGDGQSTEAGRPDDEPEPEPEEDLSDTPAGRPIGGRRSASG
ncbi:MAG: hypothetical protein RIB45_03875 [Marivibrio sp.]|uniref:hypothetical protein n=1 Tax=Marivibrio sp. TaxID=2039719 RepID=UPI0032EDBD79